MDKINIVGINKFQAIVRGGQSRNRLPPLDQFLKKELDKGNVSVLTARILMRAKSMGDKNIPFYLEPIDEVLGGKSLEFFYNVRKFFKGVDFQFLKKELVN
jgi:hypothetical protein